MSDRNRSKTVWVFLMCTALAALACGDAGGSGGCPVDGDAGTQQRIGPFATQTTAIERRREHEEAGCEVSAGHFPCYDETSTRGYCFNVFF